jgi:DNA-binding response OmpR family regulator
MKGDEERICEAGCDGYITKPIDTREFLKKITEYLSRYKFSRK